MLNRKSFKVTCLSVLATTMLAGCGMHAVNTHDLETESHFWQRANASDAIYQRGPKAQQMLHRDISRCVTELRELENLGSIRYNTPGNTNRDGSIPNPNSPQGQLAQWDTPSRDGFLHYEHMPYHDFETCMTYRGWERLDHVPYDVAKESREVYIDTILGQEYRTKTGQRIETPKQASTGDSNFNDLND